MSCKGGTCGSGTAVDTTPVKAEESSSAEPGSCCSSTPATNQGTRITNALQKSDSAPPRFESTEAYPQGLLVGLDVGSTTVKAVVIDPVTDKILWKDYQRHETKQPEKCQNFFERIAQSFPDVPDSAFRIFATGSGGANVARHVGAKFVQEVNAVSLAVEKFHPEVQSVIELGGQDAKIIVFKEDKTTGRKKKIPSMNDKCAGGTGAVIDKINAKLKIPSEELCDMGYGGIRLHPVAGKCGVFAETDINGLQKQGVPPEELMASLFESIIQQNLSVLTRGHTLKPVVLLLGGPNCYIKGMQDCWRHNIPLIWQERNVPIPPGKSIEELIITPEDAQYFAAIGAVEYAKDELEDEPDQGVFLGLSQLEWYLDKGRSEEKKSGGSGGLSKSPAELGEFLEDHQTEAWEPVRFPAGTEVEAFLGVDGGSTSTKAVLVDRDKNLIAKAYDLSNGNPIEDCMEIFRRLEEQIVAQGCTLKILGVATTGYAKDILKDVIGADVALVETVAHTESGLHFYPNADVICDVGGQDIKIIILKSGTVKDFKLNTQCSAGNGYFLQSTAQDFGYSVEEYAQAAFGAESMPQFGYGCAVFMQSDIVDFQRQGWQPEEIMAGLAAVLPKNIWLYVSQIPNLPKLGSTFILQGGTQHNLAAVKSQDDFIRSKFAGTGIEPDIVVHRHCGESGAIGCAFEAHRMYYELGHRTTFIGLEAVQSIQFRTTRNEETRCYFCKNKCLRTFIDVKSVAREEAPIDINAHLVKFGGAETQISRMKQGPTEAQKRSAEFESKVPLADDEQRVIIATCEKGTVEDVADMKNIKKGLDSIKKRYPNLVEVSAKKVFQPVDTALVSDTLPEPKWFMSRRGKEAIRSRRRLMEKRGHLRIGMPRVLNMYAQAPFFMGYFQSLGVKAKNLVWSDFTTEENYKEGAKRGSIDPCFPSKVGIPHVHNLLYHKHDPKKGKHLDYIFFPMVDSFPTWLEGVQDSRSCPTVCVTPEAVHAAFTKESDLFADNGIIFKKTFINMDEDLLCARQMYEDWSEALGVTEEESQRATAAGLKAMEDFLAARRGEARAIIDELEAEQRLGIVVLGRPYHNDPGINHEICEEFQKLGYPVISQESLPIDADIMDRLFGEEVAKGEFASPFSVEDAWKNSYSENTSRKVWAAKFIARHPNLIGLELSNFKCGHDAPIYTVVEEIVENSGTPFFYFKDIDENKPAGAIKIRIETIAYFLKRFRESMLSRDKRRVDIEAELKAYEQELRNEAKRDSRVAVA